MQFSKFEDWVNFRSLILLLFLCTFSAQSSAKFVALVIGNDQYEIAPLKNPVSDAKKIASVFLDMGYDHVGLVENADASALALALDQFSSKAAIAEVAVIYYAGHGVQIDGRNYAIPLDVQLNRPRDVHKLTSQQELVDEVARAKRFGLVILDACRDNPFASRVAKTRNRATPSRGLARESGSALNTVVAYATASDDTASDGIGRNSPFASALIENIGNSTLDIFQLFGRVRDDVMKSTDGDQQPYVYGSLGGERYYLHPKGVDRFDELDLWQKVLRIDTPDAYERFLSSFPTGVYAGRAKLNLQKMSVISTLPITNADLELVSAKFETLCNHFKSKSWSYLLASDVLSANARKIIGDIRNQESSLRFTLDNIRARKIVQTVYADIIVHSVSDNSQYMTIPLSASRNRNGVWSPVSW